MKLVFGIGINDATYPTQRKDPVWICPYYKTWKSMLGRCYYESLHYTPYYQGCTVSEDWLTFSNFKSWMEGQPWENCQLDKDILFEGNKEYSAQTCCFVPRNINILLTDREGARGSYPIGVYYREKHNKFTASVRDTKSVHLGTYNTAEEAHQAWKKAKSGIISKRVAEWSTEISFNTFAADALMARAWNLLV